MTHTLITLRPDGSRSEHFGKPILDTLQREVGGWIQEIPLFKKFEGRIARAYCDEDGLQKGLPFNRAASEAWINQQKGDPYHAEFQLVGPVVIVIKGKHDVEGK